MDAERAEEALAAFDRGRLMRSTVLLEGALLVLALFFAWLAGIPLKLAIHMPHLIAGALVGLALAGVALALAASTWAPFERIRQDFGLFVSLFGDASVLDLLLISALAGICEEALFRGFLQTWVSSWTSMVAAVVIAAALFGLVHAVSPSYAVFATVLGLALGYLYLVTDNLPAVMLAHAVYDFVALLWGTRKMPRRNAR